MELKYSQITIEKPTLEDFFINRFGKELYETFFKDYTKKAVYKEFSTLDDFLNRWNHSEKKRAVIEELTELGVFFEALSEEIGRDLDPFDIICHVAWDKPALTRKERADNVKKRNYFEI